MDAKTTQTWHLVHAVENYSFVDPSDLEELVVVIQGIICRHDLPPFTKNIKYIDHDQT
jgi:hypothetical protein